MVSANTVEAIQMPLQIISAVAKYRNWTQEIAP